MAHEVGLFLDDPKELAGLGRVRCLREGEHGRRRPLDGGQRSHQLVAHHAEEFRALPLHLLQRGYVLYGGHDGNRLTVFPVDRPGVDQGGDRPPVRQVDDHLIGDHRFAASQRPCGGKLIERDVLTAHGPEGHHLEELVQSASRRVQAADDPPGLFVDRHEVSGLRVEDQDAHGRDVDQGLQVGSRLPFRPVTQGVGDGHCRLSGKQDQCVLVFGGELPAPFLLREIDVADRFAQMTDRRPQKGLHRRMVLGKAGRTGVAGNILESERPGDLIQVSQQTQPLGQGAHSPAFLGSHAGGDQAAYAPGVVEGHQRAVAGAGQRTGAVNDFLQDVIDVQIRGDAKPGLGHPGEPLRRLFPVRFPAACCLHVEESPRLVVVGGRFPRNAGSPLQGVLRKLHGVRARTRREPRLDGSGTAGTSRGVLGKQGRGEVGGGGGGSVPGRDGRRTGPRLSQRRRRPARPPSPFRLLAYRMPIESLTAGGCGTLPDSVTQNAV